MPTRVAEDWSDRSSLAESLTKTGETKILWLLKWHSPMRTYHKSISTSIDRCGHHPRQSLMCSLMCTSSFPSPEPASQSPKLLTKQLKSLQIVQTKTTLIVHMIRTCDFPGMKNHWKTSYSKRGQQKHTKTVSLRCSDDLLRPVKKYGQSICGSSQPDFSQKHQVFWCFFGPKPLKPSDLVHLHQLCHWNPLLVRLGCSSVCRCVTNILLKWQHIV